MNYIRHLTGFYDRIQQDDRLNPAHISLYLALFQFWNLNHFQNPISISRSEMMRLSKIAALGTYHKCIKQLQDFGYIEYLPSFNPYKGSLVNLHNFDNSEVQNLNRKRIKKQIPSEQAVNSHHIKTGTGTEQALIPSINNTNISNNKHSITPKLNFDVNVIARNEAISSENYVESEQSEKEKLREKKSDVIACSNEELFLRCHPEPVEGQTILPKSNICEASGSKIPPEFSKVLLYFEEKDSTKLEAEKFYNHYESNGWLVGGKSKMKNWQAAARNWLLNSKKFNMHAVIASTAKQSPPNHLTATTNKSYQDKL